MLKSKVTTNKNANTVAVSQTLVSSTSAETSRWNVTSSRSSAQSACTRSHFALLYTCLRVTTEVPLTLTSGSPINTSKMANLQTQNPQVMRLDSHRLSLC